MKKIIIFIGLMTFANFCFANENKESSDVKSVSCEIKAERRCLGSSSVGSSGSFLSSFSCALRGYGFDCEREFDCRTFHRLVVETRFENHKKERNVVFSSKDRKEVVEELSYYKDEGLCTHSTTNHMNSGSPYGYY